MKLLTFILLLFVSSFAYADNSSMSDEEIIEAPLEEVLDWNLDCASKEILYEIYICRTEELSELHDGVLILSSILEKTLMSDQSRASELSAHSDALYESLDECSIDLKTSDVVKGEYFACLEYALKQQLSSSFRMLGSENAVLSCSVSPLGFRVIKDDVVSHVLVENDFWWGGYRFFKNVESFGSESGVCPNPNYVFDFNGVMYNVQKISCPSRGDPDELAAMITIGTRFNEGYIDRSGDGSSYWCLSDE